MTTETKNDPTIPSEWSQRIVHAMDIAAKKEIAELRRLKLPVIVSRNGKPVDINPDTNPEAPPWED